MDPTAEEKQAATPAAAERVTRRVEDAAHHQDDWTHAEERKVRWKIDMQVLTLATLIYLLSFLDRTNIGQARLFGLEKDLGLSFHDYQIALTILYVPYIILEIPSNLILRFIGPKVLIPMLISLWGLVSTLQGIVSSKAGLFAVRFFLGVTEAGIFPGIALYLTFFYKSDEIQLRQALYFSGASLAGAFNGVLSAGINKLSGKAGLSGWQWVFILEGIFTVLVGVACFFILPNSPTDLWWTSPRERHIAVQRIERARWHSQQAAVVPVEADASSEFTASGEQEKVKGDGLPEERLEWKEVARAFTDPLVLMLFAAGFCDGTGVYGLAFFLPSITKGLDPNLSNVRASLLSSPPFAAAFVVSLLLAFASDRLRWRWLTGTIGFLLAIIGSAVMFASAKAKMQYGGLIIMSCGLYSLPAMLLAWVLSSTGGYYKRASAVALLIVGTNSGGITATWLFKPTEAPRFRRGFATVLALSITGLVLISALELFVLWERKQIKAGKHDAWIAQLKADGLSEAAIRAKLGDRHPDFVREL